MAALDTLQNEGEGEEVNDIIYHKSVTHTEVSNQQKRRKPDQHILSKHINTSHENNLIKIMIHTAMNFQSEIIRNDKLWTKGDFNSEHKIHSWYKIQNDGFCYLRSAMKFDNKLKYHSINDYFEYLECGTNNNDKYLWDNTTETNVLKIFDTSRQFMYSKAEPNNALKLFGFGARDMYYMATRFKQRITHRGTTLDIVGSLNYSKPELEPKHENISATIRYRGVLLIKNNGYGQTNEWKWNTKAIYVSCFNPHMSLFGYIKRQYLKSKAVQIMQHFYDSWMDKMESLEKERMTVKKYSIANERGFDDEKETFDGNNLRAWLESMNLSEYCEIFVENGFEHLSDLVQFDLDKQDLSDIGIKKVGHRLRLFDAIRKLRTTPL